MDLELLKREAHKLGYDLVKRGERVKLLPCTCGSKRRSHLYAIGKDGLRCTVCGKEVWGETEILAKVNWNRMIEKELAHSTGSTSS